MDGSSTAIVNFIGAYQLEEHCNKHRKSFSYFDGDNYVMDTDLINGEHNFAEGINWLAGEFHFSCEAVETYAVAF